VTQGWASSDRAALVELSYLAGIPVVRMSGVLASAAVSPAREAMGIALRERGKMIILDLSAAAHDERISRILVLVMRRHAERHGVRLHLTGASPSFIDELASHGLAVLFGVHETVGEAVRVLSGANPVD
jgi:anti-anti-sigma regulatory factor